jgi:hypothetical protein
MNGPPPDEDKIRAALISAASTNQSLRRPRFKQLMQYKEQIRELRNQDASFNTIEKILKKNAFHVSHETIRIFYREVIEQKPLKRKRRLKTIVKKRAVKSKTTVPPKIRDIGEPRIARIEDL